jgi:hypothetical protein
MRAILDRGRCPDKHPPTLHSSVGAHSYDHNVASELPRRDGRIGSFSSIEPPDGLLSRAMSMEL